MSARTRCIFGLLVVVPILGASTACAGQQADGVLTVRIATSDSVLAIVKRAAEAYQAKHPHVRVTVQRGGASLAACWRLGIGEADLAISEGPEDIQAHRALDKAGKKIAPLTDYFAPGQLRVFPLGRHALAVAVHPQSDIERMDDATFRAILAFMKSDRNPDPLRQGKVRYIRDGYACNHEMVRVLLDDESLFFTLRHVPTVYPTSKLMREVAADKGLVALTRVEESLWSSGLRVLPVEVRRGQPAVLPTVANVLSGEYPYQTHLLAAVHPNAPAEAVELARMLQGPEVAKRLAEWGWITMAAKDPGPSDESVWPAVSDTPRGEPMRGAVAVLPTRLLTSAFLVGDTSLYAALEDKVAEGIRRDGTLSLLDREHLSKVLSESTLGGNAGGTVIAADVLVLLQVTTEQSVTFLRIQAFHSATATLLGEMKLPIDPARATEFQPPLETRVASWWPGVLRNLQAAGTRTAWAVRPVGDDIAASRQQSDAVQAELQRQGRVFVARYAGLADAQQEVLLALMGLARSQGASGLPHADCLLEVEAAKNGRISLCVRRGNDLKVMTEQAFATAGEDMKSWITAQATLLQDRRPEARREDARGAEAARRQATEELRRAEDLGQQYDAVVARLKREHRSSSDWPQEDGLALTAIADEKFRAYQRAAQLDPSREEALLAVARGWAGRFSNSWGKPQRLELLLAAIRAEEQFLATFPRSQHRAEILAAHASHCPLAGDLATSGLLPPDQRRVRTFFLAKAVESYREYLDKPPSKEVLAKHQHRPTWAGCLSVLVRYLPLLEAADVAAFVRDWSRRYDRRDSLHSDFLRLILLAHNPDRSQYRRDRAQYVALVETMQKRWPDPNHFQWQQAGAAVSETLMRLCGGNRSFADWLRGERGIGDLPYEGFDPDRLTGQVRVVCVGYRAPITWAAQSFGVVQRDVNVWFPEPGRDDVGKFVRREVDLFYYAAALEEADAERLRKLCGKTFPGRLLGYLPPPNPQNPGTVQRDAKPRDPVYLLVHPQAEEHVTVFADWLESPAGRDAMARYFLASPAAKDLPRDDAASGFRY